MAHEAPITLVAGEARWLRAVRHVLMLIAASGLLLAEVAPHWKVVALAVLLVVSVIIHHYLNHAPVVSRLRLSGDGLATIIRDHGPDIPALLGTHPWSGSGICILPIIRLDKDSVMRVLICRSTNAPHDYRRLLSVLRLGSETRPESGILDRS